MACRMWEPAGGMLLLVAVLVVGLALPGNAADDIPQDVRDACEKGISGNRDAGQQLLHCASHDPEGFENCCHFMTIWLSNKTDDCTCGGFKVIADRGIDINKVCNTTAVIADKCRAKEMEAARQEEEEELSKVVPCKSFFKRFAVGEASMATLQDAVACIHAVKKRPANCQKLQY